MKKLICALLILTSFVAFTQTTENVPLKSNLAIQSENFLIPKDPQKRIEYFKSKFLKNQDLKEKTNASVETELLENCDRKNEKNQKIRSLFSDNIFKSAQIDTTLMDSMCFFSFKTLSDSTLTAKIFITYSGGGNQETLLIQELDTITQQLKNTSKEEHFLDQNSRDTLDITYIWNNESNDWMKEEKQITKYDEKGNRTLSAYYKWQDLSNQWIGWFYFQYEFDKNGNQTLNAYYTWNDITNTWQGFSKSEYKFDENNNWIMLANYQWDLFENNWIGSFKTENEYSDNGNQNISVSWIWDENKKDWKYQSKSVSHYEYYDNNFSSSSEFYSWDEHRELWIGTYKYVYFSSGEYETTNINYSWNIVDEIWEPSEKIVSKGDETGLENTLAHYLAEDSVITETLINGFNSSEDLSKILIMPSCPDQSCTLLNTDVTEGDSSLLWNYNIVGSFYPDSGFCQILLDNNIDFSDYSGLFLNYKVINPSKNLFITILTEASGEVWMYQSPYILNDLNAEWQQLVIPFSNFTLNNNYVDGYFNKESIVKIELKIWLC